MKDSKLPADAGFVRYKVSATAAVLKVNINKTGNVSIATY